MKKNNLVNPFLKWVGGKRQLIPIIEKYLPKNIKNLKYVEPFIGGGALLFHIQPKIAVINDYNEELINVYKIIKNNCDELIENLKKHKNEENYFYEIRSLDRSDNFKNLSELEKASRIIFLNKTCYNGLYRVNNSGEFNSPFGRYKSPNIVNAPVLKAVSNYINNNDIKILSGDYTNILDNLNKDCFIYLDPPYHPISESSNFTGYVQGGWNENDQLRLKKFCDLLNEKKIKFLQSNSNSKYIKDLYKNYEIINVKAKRLINSNANNRGEIDEILIRNYE